MKKNKLSFKLIFRSLKEIHNIKKGYMAITLFNVVLDAFLPFTTIWMTAVLIDAVAAKNDVRTLLFYAAATVLVAFGGRVIQAIVTYFQRVTLKRFHENYNLKFSEFAINTDYAHIENPKTKEIRRRINRLKNRNSQGIEFTFIAIQNIVWGLTHLIFSTVSVLPIFFISAQAYDSKVLTFATSPIAAIMIVVMILIKTAIHIFDVSSGNRSWYKYDKELDNFQKIREKYINKHVANYKAGMDIRIYNQKELIDSEISKVFKDWVFAENKIHNVNLRNNMLWEISNFLMNICTYIFVGLRVMAGAFGVGSFGKSISVIEKFAQGFEAFTWSIVALQENTEALELYFQYMDHPSEMHKGVLPVEKRILCDGGDNDYEVEFRNVCFKYPGCENYVLNNVSLKFKIGEKLAVVGMNGSGKTTFIKLLCRLYDPTEGEILLNGINIKKYDYDEYMSIFSVVFQDFKLFAFTLGQNVATCDEYDEERVKECLIQAGFEERFSKLEDGVNTYLYKDFEEKGVEISGGEAQKIALARALYRNAPFVILDEPTAALDPVAEFDIYSRFNSIVGNRTTIYISHRLSSCRFCDSIMVFHEGAVIQRGTHDELMENTDGKYYELWTSQAQHYA